MPGYTRPFAPVVAYGYLAFLASITGLRFIIYIIDEERIPGDWASNLMREYPFHAWFFIGGALVGTIFMQAIGFFAAEDTIWLGCGEYTLTLA